MAGGLVLALAIRDKSAQMLNWPYAKSLQSVFNFLNVQKI